jgi:hypothetical protein
MRIPTKDSAGRPNGYIQTIWSALQNSELRPEQVYVTSILPGMKKGAHLHMVRRGMFTVLAGTVRFRIRRPEGGYVDLTVDATLPDGPRIGPLVIDPGVPMAMYNDFDVEALVLNMPAPAWSKDNPDDWPVDDWVDPPDWGGT